MSDDLLEYAEIQEEKKPRKNIKKRRTEEEIVSESSEEETVVEEAGKKKKKVGSHCELVQNVNYTLKRLKTPFIVESKKVKGKYEVHCMCNLPTRVTAGAYVCAKKNCKFQVDCAGLAFMIDNEFFQDLNNTKINIAICNDCGVARLACSQNEKYFTYANPWFTCGCDRKNKMYIRIKDTYRGDMTTLKQFWNYDKIVQVQEDRNGSSEKSEEVAKAYLAKISDLCEDV